MLYHLVERSTWDAALAAGEYPWSTRGVTLEQEGFVHCSTAAQVPGTSERFYADVADLLLLTIDESLLTSPVVVEQINGAPEPFPHIYGPLDIAAVVDVRPYRPGARLSRLKDLCIDCTDAFAQAHWWALTLGYEVRPYTDADVEALRAEGIKRIEDDPSIAVDSVDGVGPMIWFNAVPEPKTAKVRIHLDVYGTVDTLQRRGATVLEVTERWTVMADPEGNEFCVFPFPA